MGDEVEETEELVPVPVLEDEELEPRLAMFEEIFSDISADAAKLASIKERTGAPPPEGEENEDARKAYEAEQLKARTLMYGEVPVPVLHKMLNVVRQQNLPLYPGKGVFCDLGSGAGKSCVAAALLHPFEKCVGIECMQCLSDMAATALTKYQEAPPASGEGGAKPEVQFVKGDFAADFEAQCEALAPQVVVALAVATAYGPDQINAMAKFADKMPDGSYFICFGQGLPDSATFGLNRHPLQRRALNVKKALATRGSNPAEIEIPEPTVYDEVGWVEVASEDVEMAWGESRVFIYKKIPGPFTTGWEKGEGPWEQLVGLDKDEALAKLQEARADLQVELVDAEAMVTTDVVNERVRIRFDASTGKVVEPPRVG